MDKLIDLLFGYKKIKLFYYVRGSLISLTPSCYNNWYHNSLKKSFQESKELTYINNRVDYYNKLPKTFTLDKSVKKISQLSKKECSSVYYYDTLEYLKYFSHDLKINTLFGDIIHTPETPTIVKSRPVSGNNINSVILKLNKIRHFHFIKDRMEFSDKKNMLVGRGHIQNAKPLRIRFLETHFSNPLCDIGVSNDYRNGIWKVPFLSINEQLKFKFILCWEGNDVASNLKYVMSSNSLAVSTKPKYETWFMEGTLIPDVHYVMIKDDFSDLDEKIKYYSENIEAAQEIIKNANAYTKQFMNKKREDLISILVLEKYFDKTNQQ